MRFLVDTSLIFFASGSSTLPGADLAAFTGSMVLFGGMARQASIAVQRLDFLGVWGEEGAKKRRMEERDISICIYNLNPTR